MTEVQRIQLIRKDSSTQMLFSLSSKVQGRTQLKLTQAVRDYEATVKKDELVTASSKNAKPVASMPAASEIEKEMPGEIPAKSNPPKPLVLSNLDLELINRVLMMTPIEKVGLLKSLIEYGYRTTQSRRTQTPHVAPSCAESRE